MDKHSMNERSGRFRTHQSIRRCSASAGAEPKIKTMKTNLYLTIFGKLQTAAARLSHRLPLRRTAGLGKALAVDLFLSGFGCPAGRAQTMETITNSINGFQSLLANLPPDQPAVYVGDMGFRPAYLRGWISQLQKMAGLSATNSVGTPSAFSGYAASWPNGVVPYTYDSSMTSAMTNEFEGAIYVWQKVANLKFIQRTTEDNFIIVTNDGYGHPSDSYVGMIGGPQLLRINTLYPQMDWAHELGHAMGMIHEQQRSDRDTYVTINWGNFTAVSLTNGYAAVNYGILTNSINIGNYDYDSIMEYPTTDGNVARTNGNPTACSDPSCSEITPLEPYYSAQGSPPLGQTTHLSAGDFAAMAGQYGIPRTISGHVSNGPGAAFAGVTVAISGGVSYRGPATVTTDANGNYSFIGIPNNSGTFTISASLAGHSFNPGSWNVTVGTTDFTTGNFSDTDTTPPLVAVTSPANGGATALLTSIGGTASDVGTGLLGNQIHFTLNNNGNFWSGTYWTNTSSTDPSILLTASVASGVWTFTSVPTGIAQVQGTYYVSAFALDNAGNQSVAQSGVTSTSFTIDRDPPAVTITFPPDGSTITNQLFGNWFQGNASDNPGNNLSLTLFIRRNSDNLYWTGSGWGDVTNGYISNTYTSGNQTWQRTGALPLPGSSLGNGYYHFIAIVRDAAGNQLQVDSVVSVDFHPVYVFTAGSYYDTNAFNDNMNWSNPANWDVGSVPTSDARVVINNFTPYNTSLGSNLKLYRLDLSAGTLTTAGMVITNLNVSGGALSGGVINIPANGVFNWSGGTLVGSFNVPASAMLNISGAAAKSLGGTINSAGNATWTGAGTINVGGDSVFNNTGSFVAQNDATFFYDSSAGAQPVFNNGGSFTKTNSTGNTDFNATYGGMVFNNNGSVNVQSGNLTLGGGGTFAGGPLTIAAGSLIDFYGGAFSFNGNRTLTGPGTNLVNGASVTFNNVTNTLAGALTCEFDAGVVAGTNTFSGAGTVNWNGGTLVGSCTLPATVPLNLSGVDKALASGSTINSAGKTTWTGAGRITVQGGSVFNNTGSFVAQNDATFFYDSSAGAQPVFNNNGSFTKTNSTGTTDFNATYGGMAFNNNGTVDLRSGVLNLGGGYTPSPASHLKLALGGLAAGTQFSQLNIGGAVGLAGTLGVSLANNFTPTNGQSFAIVNDGSETGQFASQQLPALPINLAWQVNYGATGVTLNVVGSTARIITDATRLANGHFQFSLSGPNASSAIIEGSTNLLDWTSLQTNTPFTSPLLFDDPQAVGFPMRFYRATIFP